MSKVYVYSTLTNSQKYVNYQPILEGQLIHQSAYEVHIRGGANLSDKHLHTPRGVVTVVSEEDYEELQKNPEFQKHVERGFITVDKKEVHVEVAVARGMQQEDASAPVTPNNYSNQPDIRTLKEPPKIAEKFSKK